MDERVAAGVRRADFDQIDLLGTNLA